MRSEKPREFAVRLLIRRETNSRLRIDDILHEGQEQASFEGPDRALAHELVCGVVRWQATLDWLISRKARQPDTNPTVRTILRLGLYQMFWLDRIPDYACVNESVELARQSGEARRARFVNAMLRSYARERSPTSQLLKDLERSDPPLGFSHPAWMVGRWTQRWGRELAAQLMRWNNQPPDIFARRNSLRATAEQLAQKWKEEGVRSSPCEFQWTGAGHMFRLESHPPLPKLETFTQGWFYVQDPSTLLAPLTLAARQGERVLDLCAAPGGKTTMIAQQMNNTGLVAAEDTAPERLRILEANCARLGITCVRVSVSGGEPPSAAPEFDRALVDTPCSNTGVLRRRVDLRWRLRPEDLPQFQATQLGLLDQAACRVRSGGVLVYSTCSLEPEENSSVVTRFLATHPDYLLESEKELAPFIDGVDGAYVARLCRKA